MSEAYNPYIPRKREKPTKREARLARRLKAYDADPAQQRDPGTKRPGSLSK